MDNKSPNEPFPPEWGKISLMTKQKVSSPKTHYHTKSLHQFQLMFTGVGAYFGAECQKRGMLVRVAGDSIMMSPPLIISPEEIDEVIANFETVDGFCLLNLVTSFLKLSASSSSLGFDHFSVDFYLRESIEGNGREGKRTQDSAKEVRSRV